MSLSTIQKEIKEYWLKDISSKVNISEIAEYSEIYISILKNLETLQAMKNSSEKDSPSTILTDDDNTNITNLVSEKEKETSNTFAINDYVFQRRLRGGIGKQVSSADEVVELIPENVIRDEELENGDIVKIEKHYYGNNRHRFTKQPFEKVDIDNDTYEIIEYNNAIVKYDSILNQYTINSYWGEDGIKSLPPLLINRDDVERLDLHDGYIVDVAHLPERSTVRVRWSYKTDAPIAHSKPNKPTFYKENTTTPDKEFYSNIKGKTIFMVGGDSNINRYKEEIEKRGGQFFSTDSDRETMITHMIENSDIVVIPIFETSHIKMKIAKAHCNKLDIPYLILEKGGRRIFINEVECLIEDNDKV